MRKLLDLVPKKLIESKLHKKVKTKMVYAGYYKTTNTDPVCFIEKNYGQGKATVSWTVSNDSGMHSTWGTWKEIRSYLESLANDDSKLYTKEHQIEWK